MDLPKIQQQQQQQQHRQHHQHQQYKRLTKYKIGPPQIPQWLLDLPKNTTIICGPTKNTSDLTRNTHYFRIPTKNTNDLPKIQQQKKIPTKNTMVTFKNNISVALLVSSFILMFFYLRRPDTNSVI
jgi:hypothetical protein